MLPSTESTSELVITVPDPFGTEFAYATRCRTTVGALIEILAGASRRVILSAPFIQQDRGLSDRRLAMAIRGCLARGVEVDVMSTAAGLKALDLETIEDGVATKLQMFRPAANVANSRVLGSHAKFCVSDREQAYIGSANFTGPGIDGQLEVGVLLRGLVARQLTEFWMYSLSSGIFVPQVRAPHS